MTATFSSVCNLSSSKYYVESQKPIVFRIVELCLTQIVGEQLRTFENKVMGKIVLSTSIRLEVIECQGH